MDQTLESVSAHETVIRSGDGWHFTLAHAFVLFGYLVGATMFGAFGLDLLTGTPFDGLSKSYDIANVCGGATLVYLSWNVHRDLA